MEPSGTYGDALPWQLRQGGVALYRVSPKRVRDAAEATTACQVCGLGSHVTETGREFLLWLFSVADARC